MQHGRLGGARYSQKPGAAPLPAAALRKGEGHGVPGRGAVGVGTTAAPLVRVTQPGCLLAGTRAPTHSFRYSCSHSLTTSSWGFRPSLVFFPGARGDFRSMRTVTGFQGVPASIVVGAGRRGWRLGFSGAALFGPVAPSSPPPLLEFP